MLFGLLCLSVFPAPGQTLEDVLATLQVEEDGSILSDDELLLLEILARRPLDLNRVNRKEMEGIPLLTSRDVSLILQKRKQMGFFSTREEALSMPGLSIFARHLLPLITTVLPVPPTNVALRNRWVTSSEDFRVLTQGTLSRGAIDGGFTLERDPGERRVADFVSGYLALPITDGMRVIVGNHQLLSGYGLLFGRSIPYIKGYESLTGMGRLGKGLKPYRSSIEYWALRGVAFERRDRLGRWIISLTASPKDAMVRSNQVVSVTTSGLHDSPTSFARKHALREDVALLSWQKDKGEVGSYGIILAQDRWTFRGSTPLNRPPGRYGSAFGLFNLNAVQFFGEMAVYSGSPPSFLAGVIMVKKNLKWISSLRHYPAAFQGPRSQPFREWTSTLNESGIYQAVSLKVGRHRFHSYGDVYQQSSATTESGRAARGFETASTWRYRWGGGQISIRWKLEEKSLEPDIVYQGDPATPGRRKESWRLNSSVSLREHLRLQLQGDGTAVTEGERRLTGYGISVKTHIIGDIWRLSFNWVGFRADHYRSRIYVWDLNLPGELRNKTFFPAGQSVACLFRVATPTGATLSTRIRTTWDHPLGSALWSKPEWEAGCQIDIAF